MPIAGLSVPVCIPSQSDVIDGALTVEWHTKKVYPGEGKVVFGGGIIAHYGPTTIDAQELTIYQSDSRREAYALGDVEITDPEGTAKAHSFRFDWLNRTGEGERIEINSGGMIIKADRMEAVNETWQLFGVTASPIAQLPGAVQLRSPSLTVKRGGGSTVYRPQISLAGVKLATLPTYKVRSSKEGGTPLPSISYSNGLGITYSPRFLVDDRTSINGFTAFKSKRSPGLLVQGTRSLLPRNEPGANMAALSDFDERFVRGYFDNVGVARPGIERQAISERRSALTFGASFNQFTVARETSSLFSKPVDIAFEQGGPVSGWGFFSQLRLQSVQEVGGPHDSRAAAYVTLLAPEHEIAHGLKTHLRLDGAGFAGNSRFGWTAAQAGLVLQAGPNLRLGAAVLSGAQFGDPILAIDRLYSSGGYQARMDWQMGGTAFSVLSKYDFDRARWYDNEFLVRQELGSLEPFVSFREFPRTLNFGVRLRIEDVIQRLAARGQRRQPN